ncbi:MAG: hypothetical protein KatS3mg002_0142 [Candidatus Woesearchaeota archaeon]|nr:MAG: hypothetical protein KatS3mg002_0142 [Candidatus Woesearchaeota archaeon]
MMLVVLLVCGLGVVNLKFTISLIFLSSFFVSFLLVNGVNAATYYVSSNGSSTGNGSFYNAWDFKTALNNAVAGDTVLVLPGNYNVTGLSSRNSGTPNNLIVFRAYDPYNKPVLINYADNHLLRIYGNYVMFKDLVLINSYPKYNIGIWNNNGLAGFGIILDGIESEWNYPNQTWAIDNIFAANFQGSIIRNSRIKGAGHNGINIQVNVNGGSNDFILENNEIYGQKWHHAINIFPNTAWSNPVFIENFSIRNNYIHDIGLHQSAIFTRYVRGFKIYNNLMVNISGAGLSIASGDETPDDVYDALGGSFDNNVFISENGVMVGNFVANNLRIRNNIYYGKLSTNNVLSFRENYEPGIQGFPIYDHFINNNIYYSSNGPISFLWGDKNYSFNSFRINTGHDNNSFNMNPYFLSTNNFSLQNTSVGIDSGIELNYFNVDKNGVLRPQGSGWDIGAFEYVSGSTNFHSADLNNDGCVSLSEISAFVARWLNGEISLSVVSGAVSLWLNGGC